ncbi:hypothetical protein BgiMline_007743 [Biomphalaria glabrata]|nr:hypothetical protein BgiMline_018435 [Biomphalaria glabrata]KAI8788409.1 hypothetical protein BgiBS90_011077 [Biomphalaria glabrata]
MQINKQGTEKQARITQSTPTQSNKHLNEMNALEDISEYLTCHEPAISRGEERKELKKHKRKCQKLSVKINHPNSCHVAASRANTVVPVYLKRKFTAPFLPHPSLAMRAYAQWVSILH